MLLVFLFIIVEVIQIGADLIGVFTPFTGLTPDAKRSLIVTMASITVIGDIVAVVVIIIRNLGRVFATPAERRVIYGQVGGLAFSILLTLALFAVLFIPLLGYELTVAFIVIYFLVQLAKDGSTLGMMFR